MTKVKNDWTILEIEEIVKGYLPNKDISLIRKTYDYSLEYLSENDRKDVLNISYILTTVYADPETIACCFLYRLFVNEKVKRSELEEHFEKAIENEEFEIWYQPKYSAHSRKLVGAEALVRWRRADGTLIPPLKTTLPSASYTTGFPDVPLSFSSNRTLLSKL